jgi:hypothetical protein
MSYRRKMRRSKPIAGPPAPTPWSKGAITAYDASGLSGDLPEVIAMNFRRIENQPYLRGSFDLFLPYCRPAGQVIFGFLWFERKGGNDWCRIPKQKWIGRNGHAHYKRMVTFSEEFDWRLEQQARTALHALFARWPDLWSPDETSPTVQQDTRQAEATVAESVVVANGFDHHVGGQPGADVPF